MKKQLFSLLALLLMVAGSAMAQNENSVNVRELTKNAQGNWVLNSMPGWNGVLEITLKEAYRLDSIPLTWTVMVAGVDKSAQVTAYTAEEGPDTLGWLNVLEGDTVELVPPTVVKPTVKNVTLVEPVAAVPVTAITLNKTETRLGVGSTETLSVSSVTPDNATDQSVTWSSDNEAVATVNATTGEVTAVALGTANITATANDGSGVTATCAVNVSTLAAAFVDGATIKVNFKWRGQNAGDYVQGVYNAATGTFTASKGGSYWGRDSRAVYKVEKSGDNIIIGACYRNYDMEGMVWTFNTTNDTYTTTNGDLVDSLYGLISVTLNGTDITSQLTAQ